MRLRESWKGAVGRLQVEARVLALAVGDPRVPRHVKVVAGAVLAYALSPIDLIPDFIPVVGHLDDLVLVPLGVLLVRRMIPREVLEDCRRRAVAGR